MYARTHPLAHRTPTLQSSCHRWATGRCSCSVAARAFSAARGQRASGSGCPRTDREGTHRDRRVRVDQRRGYIPSSTGCGSDSRSRWMAVGFRGRDPQPRFLMENSPENELGMFDPGAEAARGDGQSKCFFLSSCSRPSRKSSPLEDDRQKFHPIWVTKWRAGTAR